MSTEAWQPPEKWMVVRLDASIPGGYRVVHYGLSEAGARAWVKDYDESYEAMTHREVRERRIEALGLA